MDDLDAHGSSDDGFVEDDNRTLSEFSYLRTIQ